jgi:putative flippase GtrA
MKIQTDTYQAGKGSIHTNLHLAGPAASHKLCRPARDSASDPHPSEDPRPDGSLPIALIPAHKPAPELPAILRNLLDSGAFQGAIVVNDGSGPESEPVFRELSRMEGVHLLAHEGNRGKGAALKTGLIFAHLRYPGSSGVVTADADGQHDPDDVVRVARELAVHPENLILGARSFDTKVPLRSRFGNKVTEHILRVLSGQKITDTQTGLRGIPSDLVPVLTSLQSDGYDFELAALLTCTRLDRGIREVGIRTIYTDGNRCSHFRPILDSMRIYAIFVRFAGVSLLSAIVDNAVFMGAYAATGNIFASQVTGRLCSLTANYFANRSAVFHSRARVAATIPGYLCLATCLMLGSYGMIRFAVTVYGWNVMVAKIGAETVLFFLSFIVQRFLVFADCRPELGRFSGRPWSATVPAPKRLYFKRP